MIEKTEKIIANIIPEFLIDPGFFDTPEHQARLAAGKAEEAKKQQAEQRRRICATAIPECFFKPYDPEYWPAGWNAAQQFLASWTQGKRAHNLILCGSSGTGKSHLAADVLLKILKADFRVYWFNTELYKTLLMDGINDSHSRGMALEMFRKALQTDVLVLDDLAKKGSHYTDGKTTSWDAHKLYLIAEKRRMKCTIVTCEWDLRDREVINRLTVATVNRLEENALKAVCSYTAPYAHTRKHRNA